MKINVTGRHIHITDALQLHIENKFKKDGYLNTTVNLITSPDSIGSNKLNLIVDINKGERINKIKNVVINLFNLFKFI